MPGLRSHRRGVALAELVVAFTLAAIVSAAAALAMLGAERYVRRSGALSEDRRAVREAELTLAADLRAVSADSLRVFGDTAAEFLGLVGTSVACGTTRRELVLPPAFASSEESFTHWRAVPAQGDIIAAFDGTAPGGWRTALADSVDARTDGAACPPSSGLVSAADSALHRPETRIVLDRDLPSPVAIGTPVRVLRWGRYVLTRGADRTWSLSYRACDAAHSCGQSQPVAGPLGAVSDSGLVFVLDSAADRLSAELRAPHRDAGMPRESVRLVIAFRNHAARSP